MVAPLTSLIYGHDGFDLDVLHNLRSFYKGLGCIVGFSRKLMPADILIIQRPPNSALDLERYSAVHIFDYVGSPIPNLLISVRNLSTVTIFAPSNERALELIGLEPALADRIAIAAPPVDPALWMASRPGVPRLAKPVHIGNYKSYYADGSDFYSSRFMRLIDEGIVDVWGGGWPEYETGQRRSRGRLGVFRVSGRYAGRRLALGMMYPNQRSISLSGRFWHAPLNGCALLSEPAAYSQSVPGVYEFDFTLPMLERIESSLPCPEAIQLEAQDYWTNNLILLRERVSLALRALTRRRGLTLALRMTSAVRASVHRSR